MTEEEEAALDYECWLDECYAAAQLEEAMAIAAYEQQLQDEAELLEQESDEII